MRGVLHALNVSFGKGDGLPESVRADLKEARLIESA
jgi:hypothetical protein